MPIGHNEEVDVWGRNFNTGGGGFGGGVPGSSGNLGGGTTAGFALGADFERFKADFIEETMPSWDKFVRAVKAIASAVWDGLVWVWENIIKKLGVAGGPGWFGIGGFVFRYGDDKKAPATIPEPGPLQGLTGILIIGAIGFVLYLLWKG